MKFLKYEEFLNEAKKEVTQEKKIENFRKAFYRGLRKPTVENLKSNLAEISKALLPDLVVYGFDEDSAMLLTEKLVDKFLDSDLPSIFETKFATSYKEWQKTDFKFFIEKNFKRTILSVLKKHIKWIYKNPASSVTKDMKSEVYDTVDNIAYNFFSDNQTEFFNASKKMPTDFELVDVEVNTDNEADEEQLSFIFNFHLIADWLKFSENPQWKKFESFVEERMLKLMLKEPRFKSERGLADIYIARARVKNSNKITVLWTKGSVSVEFVCDFFFRVFKEMGIKVLEKEIKNSLKAKDLGIL